jgi:hypothetical protein
MNADASAKTQRMLPGEVPLRETFPSEDEFFKSRPDIAGMATDDGAVVLNPYSSLTVKELDAVALNEAARVVMAKREHLRPEFQLTPEQGAAFANYGPGEAIRATVAARLLSGDPSALTPTPEQIDFVVRLAGEMRVSADHLRIADTS